MDHHHYQGHDDPAGGLYEQSPNLSQFNDQQSTSTSSSESFQTQVPLSYYLSNRDEEHRPNAAPQAISPWVTPHLGSSHFMESFHGSGKTLNPATDPYVPHCHWPQSSLGDQNFQQSHFEHPSVYHRDNSISTSLIMNPHQQGTQIGQINHMSSYQNHQSYAPTLNMQKGVTHFQQHQYGNAPSYGQYASPVGVGQFSAYDTSYQMNNAGSAAPFTPMFPAMSAGPSFHGMPHSSGLIPTGVGQPWATNFSGLNLPNAQAVGVTDAPYNDYSQGNSFSTGPTAHFNIESQPTSRFNTRQSSSASLRSKQSTLAEEQTPRYNGQNTAKRYENSSASVHSKQSTVITARTPRYSGENTVKKFERRGSMRTPLEKAVQLAETPAPGRTIKKSNPLSKLQNSRRVDIEDPKSVLNMLPTPSLRPHALGTEFSSEPRKIEGLSIRSRRGHTVSSADPAQKSAVFDWLQSTPGLDSFDLRESSDSRRRPSPPKMGLLAAGSATASSLKTIDENDPFVHGPSHSQGKKRAIDPFASMQAVVPYSNNSFGLVGQNSGMSVQLRNLTSNGTRKPTFAEAVDPKNLPFAETCRLSKDDSWGVVKIKNVSLLPIVMDSLMTCRFRTLSIAQKFSHSLVVMLRSSLSMRMSLSTSSWSVSQARHWIAMSSSSASTRLLLLSIDLKLTALVVVQDVWVSVMLMLSSLAKSIS